MRILLNGLTTLKPRTGIGQYCARLAAEMKALLGDEFAVYPPEPWKRLAARFMATPSSPKKAKPNALRSLIAGALKRGGRTLAGLHFDRYCRTFGVKLYHEPNYLPFAVNVPTVITIHDLSVLLHPEWHPADRVREHVRKLERAAANAAHVITDTGQVKREVIAELGLSPDKVTAIPLGVGPEFQPIPEPDIAVWRHRFNLPANYFLCVGTIEPRKNLLTAMRAFAALPETIRRSAPLVLAGPWGWRADAEFEYYNRIGEPAGVRHLGYVPDEAMPALYSGATAVLYPSLYEGFGLPPLEAAACGTPSICSRGTAAVCEVMGPRATYCDAFDIDGWHDAMMMHLDPRPIVSSPSFTWTRTAERTFAVYDRILNEAVSLRRAA